MTSNNYGLLERKIFFFAWIKSRHPRICFDCDVTKILHHNHNKTQGCKFKKTKQKNLSLSPRNYVFNRLDFQNKSWASKFIKKTENSFPLVKCHTKWFLGTARFLLQVTGILSVLIKQWPVTCDLQKKPAVLGSFIPHAMKSRDAPP